MSQAPNLHLAMQMLIIENWLSLTEVKFRIPRKQAEQLAILKSHFSYIVSVYLSWPEPLPQAFFEDDQDLGQAHLHISTGKSELVKVVL